MGFLDTPLINCTGVVAVFHLTALLPASIKPIPAPDALPETKEG